MIAGVKNVMWGTDIVQKIYWGNELVFNNQKELIDLIMTYNEEVADMIEQYPHLRDRCYEYPNLLFSLDSRFIATLYNAGYEGRIDIPSVNPTINNNNTIVETITEPLSIIGDQTYIYGSSIPNSDNRYYFWTLYGEDTLIARGPGKNQRLGVSYSRKHFIQEMIDWSANRAYWEMDESRSINTTFTYNHINKPNQLFCCYDSANGYYGYSGNNLYIRKYQETTLGVWLVPFKNGMLNIIDNTFYSPTSRYSELPCDFKFQLWNDDYEKIDADLELLL